MMDYMTPFTRTVNFEAGTISDAVVVQERRLADLQGMFADTAAETALLPDNPLVYRVYEATQNPAIPGQLRYSTTVIYPGTVGDEYFMTKGHYHAQGDRAELYLGLVGEGYLILQTPEGEINVQRMTPGTAAYVPPYWGHRTINVGSGNFAFFACYPADAGYDYGSIMQTGFASIVVERDGQPQVVPNPRYRK